MADIIVSTKLEKIPLNRLDYKTTPVNGYNIPVTVRITENGIQRLEEGWIKGATAPEGWSGTDDPFTGNHSSDKLIIGSSKSDKIDGVGFVTINNNNETGVDYSIGDITMHLGSIMQINFNATMQFNNYELIADLTIAQGIDNQKNATYEYLFKHAGIDIATAYIGADGMEKKIDDQIYCVMTRTPGVGADEDYYAQIVNNWDNLKDNYGAGVFNDSLYLNIGSQETIYINSNWSSEYTKGDVVENKKLLYGYSAFNSLGDADNGTNNLNAYSALKTLTVKNIILKTDTDITQTTNGGDAILAFIDGSEISSDDKTVVRTITVSDLGGSSTDLLLVGADPDNLNNWVKDSNVPSATINANINSASKIWVGFMDNRAGGSADYNGNHAINLTMNGAMTSTGQIQVTGFGTQLTVGENGSVDATGALLIRGATFTANGKGSDDATTPQVKGAMLAVESQEVYKSGGESAITDFMKDFEDPAKGVFALNNSSAEFNAIVINTYTNYRGSGNEARINLNASVLKGTTLSMADAAYLDLDNKSTVELSGAITIDNKDKAGTVIGFKKGSEINVKGGTLKAASLTIGSGVDAAEGSKGVTINVTDKGHLETINPIALKKGSVLNVVDASVKAKNITGNGAAIYFENATVDMDAVIAGPDGEIVITGSENKLNTKAINAQNAKATFGTDDKAFSGTFAGALNGGNITILNGDLTLAGAGAKVDYNATLTVAENGVLTVKDDAFFANANLNVIGDATVEKGTHNLNVINVEGSLTLAGATFKLSDKFTLKDGSRLAMDVNTLIDITAITTTTNADFINESTVANITIDAADLKKDEAKKLIDGKDSKTYNKDQFKLVNNAVNADLVDFNGDLWITDKFDKTTIMIDGSVSSGSKSGYIFGFNLSDAVVSAVGLKDDSTTTFIFSGDNTYTQAVEGDFDLFKKYQVVVDGKTSISNFYDANVKVTENSKFTIGKLALDAKEEIQFTKAGAGELDVQNIVLTIDGNNLMTNNKSYKIATGFTGELNGFNTILNLINGAPSDEKNFHDLFVDAEGNVMVTRLAYNGWNLSSPTSQKDIKAEDLNDRWNFMGTKISSDTVMAKIKGTMVIGDAANRASGSYAFGGNLVKGQDDIYVSTIVAGSKIEVINADMSAGVFAGSRINANGAIVENKGNQSVYIENVKTAYVAGGSFVKGIKSAAGAFGTVDLKVVNSEITNVLGGGFASGEGSIESREGSINVMVDGGTYDLIVGGGRASTGALVKVGTTNITVTGDTTVNKAIFGANMALTNEDSVNTSANNTNIKIDGSADLNIKAIYGGAFRRGAVAYGTSISFVNCDATDKFGTISGDSESANGSISYVGGNRILNVEDSVLVAGDISFFDVVELNGASASAATSNMDDVSEWNLTFNGMDTFFDFGAGSIDFNGDSLNLTTFTDGSVIFKGNFSAFDSIDDLGFASVSFFKKDDEGNSVRIDGFKLTFNEDKSAILAQLA